MGLPNLVRRAFGECKFASDCKQTGHYLSQSETCTKTRGIYYSNDSPAGCYVKMQQFNEALDSKFK